jgi:hypothetical protein
MRSSKLGAALVLLLQPQLSSLLFWVTVFLVIVISVAGWVAGEESSPEGDGVIGFRQGWVDSAAERDSCSFSKK